MVNGNVDDGERDRSPTAPMEFAGHGSQKARARKGKSAPTPMTRMPEAKGEDVPRRRAATKGKKGKGIAPHLKSPRFARTTSRASVQ